MESKVNSINKEITWENFTLILFTEIELILSQNF